MIFKELLTLREYEFAFEYKKSKECRKVEAPELTDEGSGQQSHWEWREKMSLKAADDK